MRYIYLISIPCIIFVLVASGCFAAGPLIYDKIKHDRQQYQSARNQGTSQDIPSRPAATVPSVPAVTATPTAYFKIISLGINPNPVKTGEQATVTIEVRNIGNSSGTFNANIRVDGVSEPAQNIFIEGGTVKKVFFTISRNLPGSYSVNAGIFKETFKVVQIVNLVTGTQLISNLPRGSGELKIDNGTNLDAVAVLADSNLSGVPLIAVYIKSSDSFAVSGVGDGSYILYFMLGKEWDNIAKMFMKDVAYKRFDQAFSFSTTYNTYMTYSVTLHPVAGGNATTKNVAGSDFPKL